MPSRIRGLAPLLIALMIATTGLLAACSPAQQPVAQDPAQPAPAEEQTAAPTEGDALYTPEYQPNGAETAVITTNRGVIKVKLYSKNAPIHVGNFVELTKNGFYDATKFHRYEPGFVVQGGDPQTKDATRAEVAAAVGNPASMFGTGGPGYMIKGEFDPATNPNKHVEGALGMARSQSPDSAGSQFYFTLAAAPFLDANYTVFGQVTDGLDVMKELRAGDEITKVEILGAK